MLTVRKQNKTEDRENVVGKSFEKKKKTIQVISNILNTPLAGTVQLNSFHLQRKWFISNLILLVALKGHEKCNKFLLK